MDGRLYDLLASGVERRILARLRAGILTELSGDIVDVASGTGLNFPHYPAGARVIAFEPDPAMALRARARSDASRATIDVRIASDAALDTLPAQSADAVVYALGLCTIADPLRSLERAKRVAKPGGRIVVIEHVRGPGLTGRLQDAIAPLWGRALGGCRPNQDTLGILRSAGLNVSAIGTLHINAFSPVRDLIVGIATLA